MDPTPLPFTLRQLQYALAVAETGGFRAASLRCSVAQPSLSTQVAALEEALGARLFERGKGGVRPTAAGLQFLARMTRILREAQDLQDVARSLRNPLEGTLRLGIIPTLAPYVLPTLSTALQAAFPAFRPLWREGQTADLVAALREGTLNGAVLALEADLGDLQTLALIQDPFHLCVAKGHPLAAGRGPLELARLEGQRLLLLEDGHCLRDQALSACGSTRLEEQSFRATSLPTLVQMVASGHGITLLPALALDVEAGRAAVATRPLAAPSPSRTVGLAWRSSSHAGPALRRCGKVMAQALESPRTPGPDRPQKLKRSE